MVMTKSAVRVLLVAALSLLGGVCVCANVSLAQSSIGSFQYTYSSPTPTSISRLTRSLLERSSSSRRRRRQHYHHHSSLSETQLCSGSIGGVLQPPSVGKTLLRGAFLRIASDLSGGTVLESIKTRVTVTREGPIEATRNIVESGGILALWTGTPSRTIEGALIGALFMLGSALTKSQLKRMGAPPTVAALAGGVVGGVAQSLAMTPAGMIFTSLHTHKGQKGYENDNALSATKRVLREKGLLGLYAGNVPMVIRQASNWASRAGFTEIARTTFGMSRMGIWGEIGSGVIGGVGSCWNTPIETIRVVMQRDIGNGKKAKKMGEYWKEIKEADGWPGLFRGVTPRGIQAIWQTVFLVVVPNMMGI